MGEINKQFVQTKNVAITTDFKWIPAETEPTAPAGYVRTTELDIDLGEIGKLFAYVKIS
ncbi:hypothetical protein MUP77_25135 [Candidatus Bathyarchaeota archaeon]|nr:hypothetical protein [Candidatus Bathyarchaeota archaeon]